MPQSSLAGNSNSIFKDHLSRWRTKSMFWDISGETQRGEHTLYTLYDEDIVRDGKTYLSLKKIYFSYDHIPFNEYDFANEHLGGWTHWNILANNSAAPIRDAIASWRTELEIKLKSMAIKSMIKSAKEDGVKGFSAAKYLADKGYATIRGRPSKEEVARERKIAAGISQELEEDMERIGLTLVSSKNELSVKSA